MRSSVVVTIVAAGSQPRTAHRRTNSSVIGCGNFGAPPKPPRSSSNAWCRRENAVRVISSVSGSCEALSSPTRAMCSAICVPWVTTSSRRSVQASRDPRQHLAERRQPVLRHRREVRAGEERLAVRRQERRHRPAAAAGHRLRRVHVDRVQVRPLLAVHLDRRRSARSSARRCPRPRTTRAPSRGTNGTRRSRSRAGWACPRPSRASSASGPHGYQSTGLCACWSRYGLVSVARRLARRSSWPSVSRATASGHPSGPSGGGPRVPMHSAEQRWSKTSVYSSWLGALELAHGLICGLPGDGVSVVGPVADAARRGRGAGTRTDQPGARGPRPSRRQRASRSSGRSARSPTASA